MLSGQIKTTTQKSIQTQNEIESLVLSEHMFTMCVLSTMMCVRARVCAAKRLLQTKENNI